MHSDSCFEVIINKNAKANFGSNIKRFQDQSDKNNLIGPGSYTSVKNKQSLLNTIGTTSFTSQARKELFRPITLTPAPGDYEFGSLSREPKNVIPLRSKVKRFDSNETPVPGPGMYDAQSSLKVREVDRAMASYLSRGSREFIKAVD